MSVTTPLTAAQSIDLPHLFAAHWASTTQSTVTAIDLATAITDIQLETTIQGAGQLRVVMLDADWSLLTSGWLDTDADGYLQRIEIGGWPSNDFWWDICAVDITTDLGQANLTLTFEDRIVAQMRDKFGHKKATRSPSMTRAEFIKSLADEVGGIVFHCPELTAKQPIQAATQGNQAATNPKKSKGIHPKAGVTVKGVKASAAQLKAIEASLAEAEAQNAPELAVVAMICAGTAESSFTTVINSLGYGGVYQGQVNTGGRYFKATDTALEAHYFLAGGKGFQGGGAIHLANSGVTDVGKIAATVEGSGAGNNFYGQWEHEARKTIAAYGGVGSLSALSSTPGSVAGTYAFTRGTTDDPDEDSWTCANRLASEVNWSLFSNGDALYYMDGPDLIGQKPSLVLDREKQGEDIAQLEFTWDNTAFQNRKRSKSGKRKRTTPISRISTPTEGKLDMVCGFDDYRAGEVIVLKGCGPADGRWIISDATRSLFNTYTEFTLSPPTAPVPEPQGTQKTKAGNPGSAPAGGHVGYPLGKRGKMIGVPYQGTHAKAFNVAGGSDNWESENAVDLGTPIGTPVLAVVDGKISATLGFGPGGSGRFAGNRLHVVGGGNAFFYTHMSSYAPGIKPGVAVKKGDVIGSSGAANGVAHLHFASQHGDPRDLIGQH